MSAAASAATASSRPVPTAARRLRHLAALASLALGALLAAPAGAGAATDQAVAYQLDPAHDGYLSAAPITAPLSQVWSIPTGGASSYPLIVNGVVYVTVKPTSGSGTTLRAYYQANGTAKWSQPLPGSSWSALAYDAGQIFIVNTDAGGNGEMLAFDATTGTPDWSGAATSLPGATSFTSAPTAINGIVYTAGWGSSGGTVYAVDEVTGERLWTDSVTGGAESSPAVDANGVYVTYGGGYDYAFSPQSGDPLWQTASGGASSTGRTPVLAGGYVFARDPLGNSFISTSSGTSPLSTFLAGPAPAVGGGEAYMLNGTTLSQFDGSGLGGAAGGWTPFTGDGHLVTAPIVDGNLVFVGSSSGTVYALDATSGTSVWSASAGTTIAAPDETSGTTPLTGLAAGEGTLIVPSGTNLVAYKGANAGSGTPTNSTPPSISGTPQTGIPLGADVGTWTGLPTSYTYQWSRCNAAGLSCSPIANATAESYTPTAADFGFTLMLTVTAKSGSSTSSPASSSASTVVSLAAPYNLSYPTVSGTAAVGQTLTAGPGTWANSPTSFTYQWVRCGDSTSTGCANINGATQSTYTVTSDDVGSVLGVGVKASNAGGASDIAYSYATLQVPAQLSGVTGTPLAWLLPPTISGTAQVGSTLTTTNGHWNYASATFTYQWQRCTSGTTGCVNITGATAAQYTPTPTIAGGTVRAIVTATVTGQAPVSATSDVTATIAALPTSTSGGKGGGTNTGSVTATELLAKLGVRLGNLRHILNLTHHGLGVFVDCVAKCTASFTLVATAADNPLKGVVGATIVKLRARGSKAALIKVRSNTVAALGRLSTATLYLYVAVNENHRTRRYTDLLTIPR